jgi:hypothetical protein
MARVRLYRCVSYLNALFIGSVALLLGMMLAAMTVERNRSDAFPTRLGASKPLAR